MEQLFQQGMQAYQAGKIKQAAADFQHVIANNPQHVDALHGLGVIFLQAEQAKSALPYLEYANQLAPNRADILSNLSGALRALERYDDAIEAVERAISIDSTQPLYHVNHGQLLHDHHSKEQAVIAYKQALALDKHCLPAYLSIGDALMEIDPVQSAQAYEQALHIDANFMKAQTGLATVYIASGKADKALALCDARLQKYPGETYAIAQKGVALYQLGRSDEAKALLTTEQFMTKYQLTNIPGFASLAEFNAALLSHVENHPQLTEHIASHATKNGRRVDYLLRGNKGPVETLEKLVVEFAQQYWNHLQQFKGHPYVDSLKPARANMHMWAVLLANQGFEYPHFHPSGKISGVYYVKMPTCVSVKDEEHQGWITFGDVDPAYKLNNPPDISVLQPEEGLMILFPSYVWHKTIPFDSSEERLSIAFDISF